VTSAPRALPKALLDDLRRRHSGSERRYHDWSHPQALLALCGEIGDRIDDVLAVECAILFHDAVYDARAADNEARSAALAAVELEGLIPPETLQRVLRMIEATAAHGVPPGLPESEARDMALFLDMDLSILGADDAVFDAYEAGVRHEYSHIPDAAFRAGRAAILEGFLTRERLYFSDWGRSRFETAARANLARSIARLRGEG